MSLSEAFTTSLKLVVEFTVQICAIGVVVITILFVIRWIVFKTSYDVKINEFLDTLKNKTESEILHFGYLLIFLIGLTSSILASLFGNISLSNKTGLISGCVFGVFIINGIIINFLKSIAELRLVRSNDLKIERVQSLPKAEEKVYTYSFNEELDKYLDDSQTNIKEKPEFILIMGGVGTGKTRLRKDQYSKGYVVIDAGDIFKNLGGTSSHVFTKDFLEPMEIMGGLLTERAIKDKRNIVTEIIGTSRFTISRIIDAMKYAGYDVEIKLVECNPEEAYKRHVAKVKRDPNYLSAYFTEKYHQKWLLQAVQNLAKNL